MGHSNGGNGSVNRRRPLLRQGGTQAKLGVEVLKMTAIAVQELENAPPQSMPKTVRTKLASASKHMQLGISSVDKGTDALLRSSGLQYAVRKRVREVHDQGIGQNAACNLIKHLEECGEACADCTTMGGTDTSDSTTAITSAGHGRLRPFRVDGFEIPMPSNERWYQHREAVKLFLRLQKEGAKLKVVYDECARREMMTVNYPCLMKKLDKVKIGLSQGFTLEKVLADRIRERPSKEKPARAGVIDIMTESQFKDAVRKRTANDRAVSSADHREILFAAKKERMVMMGRDAGSIRDVANLTVTEYEKCLGGEDLDVRSQVSHRSHARVQAAQSIMHLFTYIFTTICSHIMVADDGVGEDPPQDDWGLLRAVRDHHGVPVKPVPRTLVGNADQSTLGVKLNPDGKHEPTFYVVSKADEESGKRMSFWRAGADRSDPWVFIKVYELVSADGEQSVFMWVVMHLTEEQLPTSLCPDGMFKLEIEGFCIGAYSNGLYLSVVEYPFKRRGYYAIYLGHVKSTRLPYTRLMLAM